MEPSPRKRRPPATPGPARLVRRSILAAQRNGAKPYIARQTVLIVVRNCQAYLDIEQGWLATWFDQLVTEAERQAGALPPQDTTRKDTAHASTPEAGRRARTGTGAEETTDDPH